VTKFDPRKHHRRSIRLRDYDYSRPGAYYVTICAYRRKCLFGEVVKGEMMLNPFGEIVDAYWNAIPGHFPNVELDFFIVMPNHMHGILVIVDPVGAGSPRPISGQGNLAPTNRNHATKSDRETAPIQKRTLGQMMGYFKYQSTKRINDIRGTPGAHAWQRNYHEHVIRNEDDLNEIRQYILNNPARWTEDENHPDNWM
jgi:REP element-mobilizing transposase RayT